MPKWTFEMLAQANRETLEKVLRGANTPDPLLLREYNYQGYNHDLIGKPFGEKFRKAFFEKAGATYGLNQIVLRDRHGFSNEWKIRMVDGKPAEQGYFRVLPIKDERLNNALLPYAHLIAFNYNIPQNTGKNKVTRIIYDVVGLPNADDYNLVLGKAYLRLAPGIKLFASYFVLGLVKV